MNFAKPQQNQNTKFWAIPTWDHCTQPIKNVKKPVVDLVDLNDNAKTKTNLEIQLVKLEISRNINF